MHDAVIVGGGPGGYVAAIRLSQLGKKVALVEKENLGGTCTNKGCIPTKAMLTVAHLYKEIESKSKKLGINISDLNYDVKNIMKHTNKSISLSRKGIEYLMKKNKIDLFKGTGEIQNDKKVKIIETNEILEGKNLILAQGSKPLLFPPFDKVKGIWTSDDIFKMDKIPQSIVIVGGGVIGIEFATFFASLKTEVTIIELMNHILPSEDADIALLIKKSLQGMGVKVYEKTKVVEIKNESENFVVMAEKEDKSTAKCLSEKVLFAVGRKPNISKDVEDLGVKIERGITTDLQMRTNIENVYAIGDIRGKIMLAHVAMHEGIVAAHNIAGENMKMDYSAVPSIIFSNPEVASVGLREWQVDPNSAKVFTFPLSANGRAATMGERNGFAKVIADKTNGKILGVSIVSPSATDMIMEGVLSVKYSMTAKQIYESIHPHPTLSETLLGAFEGIDNLSIHV